MSEGAEYLANKIIEMDSQIVGLREDLGTVLEVVKALGKANKYALISESTDGVEVLYWKSEKGKIITL